ncbi:TonB family protein [Palleronia sp. LCG004]|uniref:TonB family protein n=1 Tax=Palleronia sp. LCG004 TaxID=3079304 RepID=UPI003978BEE2
MIEPHDATRASTHGNPTSEDLEPGRVLTSPRPSARSAEFEDRHRREDPEQPTRRAERTQSPLAQPSRGNNERVNAQAGSSTGRAEAPRSQTGQGGGNSREAGNAAASNYQGLVNRQISSIPRPRIGARGSAFISFSISNSGTLAGLSLVRSSGSAVLDNAALQIIRRAAPFPPPPTGARTTYQIAIEGR